MNDGMLIDNVRRQIKDMNVGAGLKNLGNTCFLNATLQTVLHTKPLMKILASRLHSRQSHCVSWCVFCELERIFDSISHDRVCSPSNLVYNLPLIFKKFRLGRQEDSHQFLRYLLEGMQEAQTGKLSKEMVRQNEATIRNTHIFSVFGGIIKTSVECLTCAYRSITTERYYDLNIECQRSNSLQEGLKSFFLPDRLEGANKYNCEKCKNKSNAIKRMFLDTVPQIMTFQFKRFTNFMRKISKFMQYPLEFNVGVYLEQMEKITMRLYGIIVHAGGSSYSGHYYAFVKADDKWFKMDDSYVSKCTVETVLAQNAYILLYERVNQESKHIVSNGKAHHSIPSMNTMPLIVNNIDPATNLSNQSQAKPINNQNNAVNNIFKQIFKKEQTSAQKKVVKNSQANKKAEKMILKNEKMQKEIKNTSVEKASLMQVEKDESDSQSIDMPRLVRRTSKEQYQSQLSIVQLILKYSLKMADLKQKNKRKKPINKTLRRRYDLRRFESKMLLKKTLSS